ncbi:aldo/keto reductase [Lichenihabitans sp. Uapishka_5]|uniref:aldo/keto reductase n=1 Tax=Lichenihabitans sp. Uapishka_5 TaxID=3037302 RepID=UPI0029E7F657|nr:aldo/keto reductase [Lichenihabitans sp. Uapishka_5]MDX7950554.1 aldo/keto reductase [Lichenihabitans sp. Uapishka_5]
MYETALQLNDGSSIPQLGLGLWKTPAEDAARTVATAIGAGYRHIDTAAAYQNEEGVGDGIRRAGVPRDSIFLTTKVWNTDQGYDETLRAFDSSLERLKMDAVNLYLIHWPSPTRGRYVDTWRALIQLKQEGRAKAIGVSNFTPEHLARLMSETGIVPVLNQVELHPHFQQRALRKVHAELGIATESWSPLGQGGVLTDPAIVDIARRHGRSPAQVIIRWHVQSGLIVIPKSVTPERIVENGAIDDFALTDDDVAAIAALDRADGRIGSNPDTATF